VLAVCEKIAAAQRDHGDLQDAMKTYQRYVEVLAERFAAESAERQRLEATADEKMGQILVLGQRTEEGIEKMRAALPVYEGLATRDRVGVEDRRTLAATHVNLGKVLADNGRPA